MKKTVARVVLFCCLSFVAGCRSSEAEKYFIGEIVYRYTYESDILNADSLAAVRPATGMVRYDHDNYQSKFLGKDTFTYYYSGSLNKCLSQSGNSQDYDCEDYGSASDSVLSFTIYPAAEKVSGYDCDIVELQKKTAFVKYYVSRELKIAPLTYQKHKAYNWDVYGEKAKGGLILKLEHRFKNFTMKGIVSSITKHGKKFTAIEIDEKKMMELCNAQRPPDTKK